MMSRKRTSASEIAKMHSIVPPTSINPVEESIPESLSERELLDIERVNAARYIINQAYKDGGGPNKAPKDITVKPLENYSIQVRRLTTLGAATLDTFLGVFYYDANEQIPLLEKSKDTVERIVSFEYQVGSVAECIQNITKEYESTHAGAGLLTLGAMVRGSYFQNLDPGNYMFPGFVTLNNKGEWCVLNVSVIETSSSHKVITYDLAPLTRFGQGLNVIMLKK